jgi:hypothetical protein
MKRSIFSKSIISTLGALSLGLAANAAMADLYQVSVTNITAGLLFTPRLVITHTAGSLWTLGMPAIPQLAAVAEGGETAPLQTLLGTLGSVITDNKVGDGMLAPGTTQSITINGTPGKMVSVVFMLLPTNDGFSGINGAMLPMSGTATYMAPVYDSGSELNDETCTKIPGPQCGGEGTNTTDKGEGFVHIHPGLHGKSSLDVAKYSWNNPVVQITVTKL